VPEPDDADPKSGIFRRRAGDPKSLRRRLLLPNHVHIPGPTVPWKTPPVFKDGDHREDDQPNED
jgi:hypothetical protein